MKPKKFLLAATCLCIALHAHAQTEKSDTAIASVHDLDEVLVLETRQRKVLSSTAPLHILGRGEFLSAGVTDIADALHRLPGITLRDYGGAGGLKTVSVRGFGSKHTGVSYDGVMLSECQSGEIDLSRYSLENVDELSLVIGDNDDIFIPARQVSTTSVLNVKTISPPTADCRPHLTTQLKFGSFGYVSPFVRYEQSFSKNFALSLTGEYTYAENDYPFTLRNMSLVVHEHRTNSRMNSGHGEVDFIWNLNKWNRLSGKLYYYDNNRQLPGQVRYYTNLSKEQLHDQNFFGQLHYLTRWADKFSLKWIGKFNWASSKYKDPLYSGNINDAFYWQREAYTSVSLLYAPIENWVFDYSADYAFNNLNSSLATDTHPYRHSILQSATAKYSDGRLTALARVLWSVYLNGAQIGDGARDMRRLSPSLSLSYKLFAEHELYLRASYKNIFRVPTFNESYFFHYGSTDLAPELTDQYNIGVTWKKTAGRKNDLFFTLDGYLNHVKDKIVAVPLTMFVWTNINVGKVRVLGYDVTANATHHFNDRHRLLVSGNYSYQRAVNRTNTASPYYNLQIAYMPMHSGAVSVGYENPIVNVSFHGVGVSSRWTNNEHYEGTKVAGYMDFGLTAYRHFTIGKSRLETRFDLKNIFNKQYDIVRYYPMPRRSYQFSISYKF